MSEIASFLILGMPLVKFEIESRLSVQERRVLAAMRHFEAPAPPREVAKASRIFQHNHASAILFRLAKKGFAVKKDGGFALVPRYRDWLRQRCGFSPWRSYGSRE